jgi:hypothetical protein
MSAHIRNRFQELGIIIGPKEIEGMFKIVTNFELRSTHPLALNSPLIGVYAISFIDNIDARAMFDLFKVREDDLRRMIKEIPSIDNSFRVFSDPFNLLCIWVVHLGLITIKNPTQREEFCLNVLKLLNYKFFTGIVNRAFKYLADEKVMAATLDGLSRKSKIKVYGTWKKLIEARCKSILSYDKHYKALIDAAPDIGSPNKPASLQYVLTDTRTRMVDRVKNVTDAFYQTRVSGSVIKSTSSTRGVGDEKYIVEINSTIESMVVGIVSQLNNANSFLDYNLIRTVTKQYRAVSSDNLKKILTQMTLLYRDQILNKTLDTPLIVKADKTDVGIRILIKDIIQNGFRYSVTNGVSPNDFRATYFKIIDGYSSSRIADEGIKSVRDRLIILVDNVTHITRENTKSSFRLAIISYIILKSISLSKSFD